MLDFEFLIFGIVLFGSYIFLKAFCVFALAIFFCLSITQFIFFVLGFAFKFQSL